MGPPNPQAMADFNQCAHGFILTARDETEELPPWRPVDGLLCAALANMSAVCNGHLTACFAPADREQMVHRQVGKRPYC